MLMNCLDNIFCKFEEGVVKGMCANQFERVNGGLEKENYLGLGRPEGFFERAGYYFGYVLEDL
jgi:hypothetical protein